MKIILTLLFVTCASAMSLLGSKKCSWGPSYWCSHVTKARECGAFKHCLDSVWSKQIIKQTSPRPQCDLCQMVIKETRLMLKRNNQQKEVLEFFSKSCKFMPDSDLQKECNYLVNNDLDGLMTLLKSSLTEEQMCATVSLCQGFEDQQHGAQNVQPLLSEVGPSKMCNDCIAFTTDLQKFITDNDTVDQIKEEIKQVLCIYFGQEQGLCNIFVDQLIPQALQMLASEIDPQVFCAVIAFCNGTNDIRNKEIKEQFMIIFEKISKIKKTEGDEECLACEEVVLEVKNVLSDTTDQKKIIQLVEDDVCVYFKSLEQECKTMVEQYSPMLFALLIQQLDGKALCTKVGLCQNGTKKMQLPMKQVVTHGMKSEFSCSACKEAVNDIDHFLEEPSTQDAVEAELNKVCDRLSTSFKADCKGVVAQYTPAIIEMAVQKLSPPTVCKRPCNTSLKKTEEIKQIIKPVKKENIADSTACEVCELAMEYVRNELKENSTQEEIENLVLGICDKLPSSLKDQCTNFVNTYGQAVIKLLVQKVDPKTICTAIGLCSSVNMPVQKVNAAGSVECVMCEYAMRYIDQTLAKNSTKADIENFINGLCEKLPKSVTGECKLLVDMYGKQIVDLLVKGINPKVICTEIHLCPAVNMPGKHDVRGNKECALCEFMMNELASVLKKNSTKEDIENLLNAVCRKLPKTVTAECEAFVAQYTPLIVQFLKQEIDPKQVCTALGVCSAMSVKKVIDDSTPECQVCESVCEQLKILLEKNSSQQAIKEALESGVCTHVPVGLKTKCQEIVDRNEEKIMKKLIDGVTPKKVCELMHVCSGSQAHKTPDPVVVQTRPQLVPLELMPIPGQIPGVKLGTDQCVTCETLVNYLGLAFKERSTVGAVETFLKNEACKIVKGNLNKECLSIVQNYTPVIALKFANNIDPKQICQDIKQCPTKLDGIRIRPAGFAKNAKLDSTLYYKPQRKMSRNVAMPLIKIERLAALKDKLQN